MARISLTKEQLRDLFGKGRISKADYDRVTAPPRMQQIGRQVIAEIPRRTLDAPVYFEVPMELWTENRLRAMHPIARGKHLKKQRATVRNAWALHIRGYIPELPVIVTQTRFGRRTDGHDSLAAAFKHVTDEITELLGLRNDDTPLVTWEFDQRPKGDYERVGIRVEARCG